MFIYISLIFSLLFDGWMLDLVDYILYNSITMDNKDIFEKSRNRIKFLLEHYEYGKFPPRPLHMNVEPIFRDRAYAAGKATLSRVNIILTFENGEKFGFPISYAIPEKTERPPVILHLSYTDDMPNKHQPTEELCDEGFAVFTLGYKNITENDGNFRKLVAKHLIRGRRTHDSPGKLMMWAWGAIRVMDFVRSLDKELDTDCITVIGHGILGTAALLAAAFDERFFGVISSCSGFGGAASVRGRTAPLLELKSRSPHLFCGRYLKLSEKSSSIPFDQDSLLALIAPRALHIDTADDCYTDAHIAEQASAERARAPHSASSRAKSQEYAAPCEVYGENELLEWRVSFRLRDGFPYISREDWKFFIGYIRSKRYSK